MRMPGDKLKPKFSKNSRKPGGCRILKEGKLGERSEYTGYTLTVGIAYHKDGENKKHECKVELLWDRLS